MKALFHYNWQVRDEWFELCKELSREELLQQRIGGVGSIMRTLFHVVDVEISWIYALQDKDFDFDPKYEDYKQLEKIIQLSHEHRPELEAFLVEWTPDQEEKLAQAAWLENESFTHGEILRHVIAHEIHHMGQLSVWVREIGQQPISANFIGRGLR